ncbi:MAG: antirestriction protein ArdA [Myxococcales bacterium]
MDDNSQQNLDTTARTATDSPRIYVACLASYNSGVLHGTWIAAGKDPHDIHADIQAMLAQSREPIAEEWAIHDFEGFHGVRLAEYESIEKVSDIANLIAEHGQLGADLISHCDSSDAAREALDDNYQGSFASPADWAEQLLADSGDLAQIPERLRGYFDFESYARDAELSGDIFVIEVDRQHHVFWSR